MCGAWANQFWRETSVYHCGHVSTNSQELSQLAQAAGGTHQPRTLRLSRGCGPLPTDCSDLRENVEELTQLVRRLMSRLEFIERSQPLTLSERAEELLVLFCEARGEHASNDRDRVYGLMGACTALMGGNFMPVNYESSTQEVFTQFARSLLNRAGSLLFLNQATPHKNALLGLPSWVPDWTSPHKHHAEQGRLGLSRFYNACPVSTQPVPEDRDQTPEPSNTLRVRAFLYKPVEAVGTICYETKLWLSEIGGPCIRTSIGGTLGMSVMTTGHHCLRHSPAPFFGTSVEYFTRSTVPRRFRQPTCTADTVSWRIC